MAVVTQWQKKGGVTAEPRVWNEKHGAFSEHGYHVELPRDFTFEGGGLMIVRGADGFSVAVVGSLEEREVSVGWGRRGCRGLDALLRLWIPFDLEGLALMLSSNLWDHLLRDVLLDWTRIAHHRLSNPDRIFKFFPSRKQV
ncbi:uncharacterized protein BJX67DRAFT_298606 [Aspergillus lucknowensis]|uniref:Uncharacterized protein n=1 Tax=Aspergillus lucknowensis TaxID=176173 RepID=A0ABR4LD28_9EURO